MPSPRCPPEVRLDEDGAGGHPTQSDLSASFFVHYRASPGLVWASGWSLRNIVGVGSAIVGLHAAPRIFARLPIRDILREAFLDYIAVLDIHSTARCSGAVPGTRLCAQRSEGPPYYGGLFDPDFSG
jgi:hypothetical protein